MSELQLIETTLQRAARRRRLACALWGLWRGLLAGSLLWLIALGVYKLWPIPVAALWWTGGAALLCPLVGFLLGGWRKPGLPAMARWLDVKQNLKERLSTALEVGAANEDSSWGQLVVSDAAAHVSEIDPRRLVRFTLPKAARWAVLVLVLAVGLGFVPEYRSKAHQQKQADAKNIKEVGKQLADLTRRDLAQRKPARVGRLRLRWDPAPGPRRGSSLCGVRRFPSRLPETRGPGSPANRFLGLSAGGEGNARIGQGGVHRDPGDNPPH